MLGVSGLPEVVMIRGRWGVWIKEGRSRKLGGEG